VKEDLDEPSGVRWSPLMQVIYVPCKQAYIATGVRDDIWWKSSDLHQFKIDAEAEVSAVMKERNLDVKGAIAFLFQPDDVSALVDDAVSNDDNDNRGYGYDNKFFEDCMSSPSGISRSFSVAKSSA
jgi:hypothetical protein